MKAINWWLSGYSAAMRAGVPSEFNDAISAAGERCDVAAFLKGWHSAWRCERKAVSS